MQPFIKECRVTCSAWEMDGSRELTTNSKAIAWQLLNRLKSRDKRGRGEACTAARQHVLSHEQGLLPRRISRQSAAKPPTCSMTRLTTNPSTSSATLFVSPQNRCIHKCTCPCLPPKCAGVPFMLCTGTGMWPLRAKSTSWASQATGCSDSHSCRCAHPRE